MWNYISYFFLLVWMLRFSLFVWGMGNGDASSVLSKNKKEEDRKDETDLR